MGYFLSPSGLGTVKKSQRVEKLPLTTFVHHLSRAAGPQVQIR